MTAPGSETPAVPGSSPTTTPGPGATGAVQRRQAAIGIALSLTAGLCLSTGGLAIRLVEQADGFQVLFYRALTFLTVGWIVLACYYRGRLVSATLAIGAAGAAAAVLLGLGAICYVLAILHTTVASTVVILSTAPLLTALLAWLALGRRVAPATLGAALTALAGVALMVIDGLAGGGLLGMAIAFLAACCFAIMLVIMQRQRGVDMLPATALSGLVTLAIAFVMAPDLEVSSRDLAISAFLGAFQFGLGFACITLATRYLDGALVALLSLSEVVLAPIWVWLGVGEVPGSHALAGASIVFAAVVYQAWRAHADRP